MRIMMQRSHDAGTERDVKFMKNAADVYGVEYERFSRAQQQRVFETVVGLPATLRHPTMGSKQVRGVYMEQIQSIRKGEVVALGATRPTHIRELVRRTERGRIGGVIDRTSLSAAPAQYLHAALGQSSVVLLDLHGYSDIFQPYSEGTSLLGAVLEHPACSVLLLNIGEIRWVEDDEPLLRHFLLALASSCVCFGFMEKDAEAVLQGICDSDPMLVREMEARAGGSITQVVVAAKAQGQPTTIVKALLRVNRRKEKALRLLRQNLYWCDDEGQCWRSPRTILPTLLKYPAFRAALAASHTDWVARPSYLNV